MINRANEEIYDYIFSMNEKRDRLEIDELHNLERLFKTEKAERKFWNREVDNFSGVSYIIDEDRYQYDTFPKMKTSTKEKYLEYKTRYLVNEIFNNGKFDYIVFKPVAKNLAPEAKKTLLDYCEKKHLLNYKGNPFLSAGDSPVYSIIFQDITENIEEINKSPYIVNKKIFDLISMGENVIEECYHDDFDPKSSILEYPYISGSLYESWLSKVKLFSMKKISDPFFKNINDLASKHDGEKQTCEIILNDLLSLASEINDIDNNYNDTMNTKKYDVFISHASIDKLDYVDSLYETISNLGINVFYDSKVISWGDDFKKTILNGINESEFAIIVISKSFFGREWTEKELSSFFQIQNLKKQKIILPLLYNVTVNEFVEKYPYLDTIQAISSEKYSNEQISILLAKELIKRYHP